MPDRRAARRRHDDDDPYVRARDRDSGGEGTDVRARPSPRSRHAGLTAAEAARTGLRQIAELTGKQPQGITGVEAGGEGWIVGVEVVEDQRVPSSADILAIYETEFDMSGELLSYRRVRRYARGRGDSSGGP
jgi:Gas vesicle synthesis protein GvpO